MFQLCEDVLSDRGEEDGGRGGHHSRLDGGIVLVLLGIRFGIGFGIGFGGGLSVDGVVIVVDDIAVIIFISVLFSGGVAAVAVARADAVLAVIVAVLFSGLETTSP